MPLPSPEILDTITAVHRAYLALMRFVADIETGLGGQLLYVGELDARNRQLTVAANIAGCATLAASADGAALRLAMREGTVDFLVNSLDEALRILKNEIRKRQPVAVAISKSPAVIEAEMLERGVLPDLIAPSIPAKDSDAFAQFKLQGARPVQFQDPAAEKLLIWTAPAEYAQNLAGFGTALAACLAASDYTNHRWLRLSPRYLGSAARNVRSVSCDPATALRLVETFGRPLNP